MNPKRKNPPIDPFRVIFDMVILSFDRNKYRMSNKKRTGRNHSQF
jgi:hypothetical protein